MVNMVTLRVKKKYHDVVLNRRMMLDEIIAVTEERARALVPLGLVEIIRIDKFSRNAHEGTDRPRRQARRVVRENVRHGLSARTPRRVRHRKD